MDNADAVNTTVGILPPPTSESSSKAASQPDSQGGPRRSTRRIGGVEVSKQSKTKSIIERISPPVEEPSMCPICCDDNPADSRSLICGHKFCSSCWGEYVRNKVRNEAEQWITCMAEGCNLVAPDKFVKGVLSNDQPTWHRFKELLVRHYVASNNHLKYCPYPSCTYTVSCPAASSKSALATIVPIVTCGASNTHKFCFGCTIDDDHRPVVCAVAKLWLQKCQDDSETANWIKTNTKECSKCQSTIEKNGGCKYVTVINSSFFA
jgi:ariadne-1